jgi:hypothetical protein
MRTLAGTGRLLAAVVRSAGRFRLGRTGLTSP